MQTITLKDAQLHFDDILDQVVSGQDIVISDGSRPVAIMLPVHSGVSVRMQGTARGQIQMAADFNAPMEDFKGYQ